VRARIATEREPKPPLIAGSTPVKITTIPNAHAKAFAGIHSAAWLTNRRKTNHWAKPKTGPSTSPIKKANAKTTVLLGSAGAAPAPPESAPSESTVLGIIPRSQAKNAPALVAPAQVLRLILGNGTLRTDH